MQVNPMKIDTDAEKTKVEVTDFVLAENGAARILQAATGKILLINNKYINMTRGNHHDQVNGETEPVGPYIIGGCQAYWKNNVMEFITLLRGTEKHEHILEQMEMVDLTAVYEE